MDFIIILVLMIALYLVPELLRRRNPKEYKYPDIPAPPSPVPVPSEQPKATTTAKTTFFEVQVQEEKKEPAYTGTPASAVTVSVEPKASTWQGNIDQAMIMNGIIFAEILNRPRAHQILYKKRRI